MALETSCMSVLRIRYREIRRALLVAGRAIGAAMRSVTELHAKAAPGWQVGVTAPAIIHSGRSKGPFRVVTGRAAVLQYLMFGNRDRRHIVAAERFMAVIARNPRVVAVVEIETYGRPGIRDTIR